MSLTRFLAKPDVRAKFSSEFEKPKFQVKKEIVALPLTKRYSLVGTAFDYLLRFHLEYWYPQFIQKESWVAEGALRYLRGDYLKLGKGLIKYAKDNVQRFLETGRCDYKLLKSALLLGGLDTVYRTGFGEEYLGEVHRPDVKDLGNLIAAVDMQIFTPQKRLLLNPGFGRASLLVGGADADLIIDDMLIDIKTSKKLEFSKDHFHQLIGYLTLYYLNGVIERKKSLPEINKLAIYYSRYSYLHVIPVESVTSPENFAQFGKWFHKRAKTDQKQYFRLVLMKSATP